MASSTASAVASAYTYNDGNQLTAMNSRSFTYDNQGNEITDGSKTLSYNYDNQLVSFTSGGGTATSTEDIYTDATSWNDWSWDVTNDFNESSVVYSGSSSIEVIYDEAWGGLYLEDSTGIDTTDAVLHFAVRSSSADPLIEIDAYGPSDTLLGDVTVDSYVSSMSANTWYEVDIPLTDLNATSTTLTGFSAMRSTTGTLYFDDIMVVVPGTGATTTTTFVYDALGNRIEKNINGTPTYEYVNGPGEHVLVTTDVVQTTTTYYLYGLDLISQGGTASTSREYYLTDGQGNVRYVTDESGTIIAEYTYDPYGNETTGGPDVYGFQSQQIDFETDLVYLRARYYDSTTGRFTAVDPFPGFAGNPAGQNGYNYANNDPVNLTDPDGEFAIPGAIIGGFIGGAFGALEVRATNPNATLQDYLWGVAKGTTGGAAVGFSGAYAPIIAGSVGVAIVSTAEDLVTSRRIDPAGVGRDVVSNIGGEVVAAPFQMVRTTNRLGRFLLETNGSLISSGSGFAVSLGLNNPSTPSTSVTASPTTKVGGLCASW